MASVDELTAAELAQLTTAERELLAPPRWHGAGRTRHDLTPSELEQLSPGERELLGLDEPDDLAGEPPSFMDDDWYAAASEDTW